MNIFLHRSPSTTQQMEKRWIQDQRQNSIQEGSLQVESDEQSEKKQEQNTALSIKNPH
eukprot:TRINITY_DN2235_c0_g1_i1.p4 TRINITY_DN2235_c0_g1~~TRINITY_DN2235_c0_g1_i1.p4  ORF type:complete len:58 (-),score=12.73 TRINITY_DN2235_c0_g1_i1:883-1056(-)